MDGSAHLAAGKLPGALLQRLIEDHVRQDASVIIGPEVGADAAALRIDSQAIVVKSDPITFPTPDIARYLVLVNANDVVCMGGRPRWLLVTALLPAGETTAQAVEAMFRQLAQVCAELEIVLVGGHTEITESVRSPVLVGMLIGEADEASLFDLRRGRPGDALLLCNSVAIEGTAILASALPPARLAGVDPALLERARTLTDDPGISILPAAQALRDSGAEIRGFHDPTEGGIATAIYEVARVTGCDIELDGPIPIRSDTAAICSVLGLDPLGLIASGALLAVLATDALDTATQRLRQSRIEFTHLGRLTDRHGDEPAVTRADGRPLQSFPTDEIARYFSTLA